MDISKFYDIKKIDSFIHAAFGSGTGYTANLEGIKGDESGKILVDISWHASLPEYFADAKWEDTLHGMFESTVRKVSSFGVEYKFGKTIQADGSGLYAITLEISYTIA